MTSDPSRRSLLLKAAPLLGAAAVASCAPSDCPAPTGAAAGKTRKLKMVTAWPPKFPGLGTGVERIAKRIEVLSAGRISVKVYAAGEAVGGLGAFDAVSGGQADLYHAAEYYWQGKSPAYNFFAAIPMGMTGNELKGWVRHGGGQELWDELSAPFNIKPFQAGNSGTQMGGWYAKDINSVDDFKGLRIRMPGVGGEILRRLGATPVTKSGGEIFQALSQGNIDATEWIGPWNDLAFGFHKLVKNYYYPGFHEPGPILSMGINKQLWDDMDELDKMIIQTAADAENDVMHSEFDYQNAKALDVLVKEHGVQVKSFPSEVLAAIKNVADEVIAELANNDPLTKRIYDSYMNALERSRAWTSIAEESFIAARKL